MADNKRWSPSWDLSTIPDVLIASEAGRRNNAKRQKRSGGVVWGVHRTNYPRCRCAKCAEKRAARKRKA